MLTKEDGTPLRVTSIVHWRKAVADYILARAGYDQNGRPFEVKVPQPRLKRAQKMAIAGAIRLGDAAVVA